MKPIRIVLAAIAGLAVSFAGVFAAELFSNQVHPFPEGFGGTQEEICQHVERYPQWVLAVAVLLWAASAFAGAWVAQKFGNLVSSLAVGLLLLAALILNLSMLPYPIWFKAACLVAIPAAMAFAIRMAWPKMQKASAAGQG